MVSKKPILVTGMPRSGSSWVGRMIAHAHFVRYVHEPFNLSGYPCHCGVKFDYRYYYLYSGSVHKFYKHLNHTIYPAYSWIGFLNFMTEMWKNKRIRSSINYLQSHLFYRPVVKDPTAVFSAATLADLFHMDVVVLIRHPAAIVSSYKTLKWEIPFSHFIYQSKLIEDYLARFQSEINDFAENKHDIIDQVALLWKLIHYAIIKYQRTQSNWIFVRYENLVSNPIDGYQNIFNKINLPFSDRIRRVIEAHSSQEQLPTNADPYAIKRNPHQVLFKWKKNLTSSEIHRIRARVEDVSSAFFSDEDWKI